MFNYQILKGMIASLLCLSLMACTTTQTAQIDATVQKSLPAICANAATAKPIIALLIENGKLSGKKADAATAALASLDTVCADPANETAAGVLVAAVAAYLTVSTALKSGQTANG